LTLLVLFDVDGTLLLEDAYAHGRAMVRAMRKVWRVDLADDVVERIEPWGKTDRRIARESLLTAGVGAAEFERGLDRWMDAASRAFEEERASAAPAWRVRDGVGDALERLAARGLRLTLVTGNLKPIAAAKMLQIGLLGFLDLEIGAYGSDAEKRAELVPLARRRAAAAGAPWPRERTVVVGDTPGDAAAADADGVASLLFASARYPAVKRAGATRVVTGADDLVAARERMAAA
jgi:phosphoglycolate phosphatase